MPTNFTPKFVDMVRVTTSSQGQSALVCGPAVQGFASFADSVSVEDSFYYSVQGVDKPQEREVGRGTFMANGTISREPLSGNLTNFTPGTKTISLVTASEWFAQVEQASLGSDRAGSVATRSELASTPAAAGSARYLLEAGRDGQFVFKAGDLSAMVAADTQQAIYIAPASAPTGSAGAWVRRYSGPVCFEWFGAAAGDYALGISADCLPAFNALKTFIKAQPRNKSVAYQAAGPEVQFGGSQYYFSDTLTWDVTMRWRGMGSGHPGGEPTWLRWPADKGGILFKDSTSAAGGSILEGFLLQGGAGSVSGTLATDLLKSGIRLLSRAVLRDVYVRNFAGAGVCISAAVGGSDANFTGNANNWRIDNARLEGCKSGGLYVSGGDANAGVATLVDASLCGRFGIYDASFLGNSYIGCHADACGLPSSTGLAQTSQVSYGGTRYYLRDGSTVAVARATTPGTDANVWVSYESGGVTTNQPAWSATGNYVAGGAYGGPSPYCSYVGCYYETGQSPPQVGAKALVVGGFMFSQAGDAPWLSAAEGRVQSTGALSQLFNLGSGQSAKAQVGGRQSGDWADALLYNSEPSSSSFDAARYRGFVMRRSTGDLFFSPQGDATHAAQGFPRTFGLLTDQTNLTFGADQAQAGRSTLVEKLTLGVGNAARVITMASAVPNSDAHGLGEIAFNDGSIVSKAAVTFWECLSAGSPGVWVARKVGGSAITSQGGSYTPVIADADSYIRFTASTAASLTVPANSAVPFPIGTVIEFEQGGAGEISAVPSSGVTLNKRGTVSKTAGQYAVAFIKKVGPDSWTLGGDVA